MYCTPPYFFPPLEVTLSENVREEKIELTPGALGDANSLARRTELTSQPEKEISGWTIGGCRGGQVATST